MTRVPAEWNYSPPAAGKLFSNCLRSGKGPLIGLDKLRSFNWNGVAPPRIIMESNVSMGWLGYRIFFFVYRYEFVVCWFLMKILLVGKLEFLLKIIENFQRSV